MTYRLSVDTLSPELANMLLKDVVKLLDAYERVSSDAAIRRAAQVALRSISLEVVRGEA